MSLYINNGSKEPTDIYYQNKIVNSVFYNNKLVWGEDLDIDDWQEIIKTIQDKKNGIIDKWPSGYYVGKIFTIALNGTTDYWNNNFIKIRIIEVKDTSLVFCLHTPNKSITYYDANDLYNFKGYINSNPRRVCLELEDLLPFKDYLIKKTFSTKVYTVLEVNNNEVSNSTSVSQEISDGVFLPVWTETEKTAGTSRVPTYDFYHDDLGEPNTVYFWLRGGGYFSSTYYGGLIYYALYGRSALYGRMYDFTEKNYLIPLFEIG